jgi:hypothetical protein
MENLLRFIKPNNLEIDRFRLQLPTGILIVVIAPIRPGAKHVIR